MAMNPDPREGHESVLVNNKLLVWGGVMINDGRWRMLSRCECHTMDLSSQQWSQKISQMDNSQDEPTPCLHARCAIIENMVYPFGGWYIDRGMTLRLQETFSFDCEKMKWKKLEIKGKKPIARNSCGLCAVGETLLMVGGAIPHSDRETLPDGAQYKQHTTIYGYTNDCWEFNPREVSWTPLKTYGCSPSPRAGHSFTAVTPYRIVLYGGRDPIYLSDMHLLDGRDGVWTWNEVIHSVMWPAGRAYHTTCFVSPSLCVVMGGWVAGGHLDDDAYVIDIERGTAFRITLGDARADHTACCRVASDGSALIFVFGGTRDEINSAQNVISDFRVYSWDPQTPLGISVCDNLAAWLERDGNHELKQETTVEKEELFSHIDSLTKGETRTFERKKEVLESPNAHLAVEGDQIIQQCERRRAEKGDPSSSHEGERTVVEAFLASQGWEFDVFISHAGPDRAFVAMLHAEMLKCGLKTFVDVKSLEMVDSVQRTVARAIVMSPFFVVVLSNNFQDRLYPEAEVEAALTFPEIHKKIIPVFYQMSVDDCHQSDKELYQKLAAIAGLHKGYRTDEQFAKSISEEVMKMALEQIESNSLTLWKPEGVDWKFNSNLDQLELLFQLKDDLQRFTPVIESVLDSLGPEGRQHFLEAIEKGTMKIARVNLDMLGDGEAGKSSLGDSLMDEPFIKERESTDGATVMYMIQTATGYSSSWKKDENRSCSLGQLLARGSVLACDRQSEASEVEAKLSQAQLLSDAKGGKEDISTSFVTVEDVNLSIGAPSVTVERLELSSSGSIREESSQVSGEDKHIVVFGEEFQKAKDLTEERAKAIKSLQDDPDELQKQDNLIYISVCDRGGQKHFLPIHTALIANCSEFIPKAYLLVFDLTKRLGEVASATFRAERGAGEITYTSCPQMKNEEIISLWASVVDLAHPESEMQLGTQKNMRPFLGQHKVRRGPAMFIIGTHYDEIVERGEEGQELVIEQEVAVQKILSKHKYIERVVAADDKKSELIFKVDNTRSGTGSPDPMVNTLRKLVFDMAMTYRDKMKATPLPYVVLELGLLNVSQPEGPGSSCDSDRKIVNIKDIVPLAQQYCDINGLSRCKTALRYLSSVGVIFYFFKAFGLTDKVFTDPQWLFDVMSTFVTILGGHNVSHLYLHDLKLLKEEGRMSRQLAEHLLERRQKLGVKPKHYNTIFHLLQLADVFCPAFSRQSSAKLTVNDAKDFYVPCMLETDYKKQTAWELSGVTGGDSGSSDSACLPPSLIFKPENVDYFPEPLFFRLSSRTAYQFPEFPRLKRNRIQVHMGDSELDLELLYHHTSQYVIATAFPRDIEEPLTPEVVHSQCSYVRRFLCWQLNDAKRNGIDGFEYKVYFQVGKKPGKMDVDEECLFLLPDCHEMPKMIINPTTKTCLGKRHRLSVKSWYSSEAPECGDAVLPSNLLTVANSVQRRWMELAGAMEPRPFYRNELIKFEDDTDYSESGKALRMLQEWQREHKDQATTSNLKRALASANFADVISKVDHGSSCIGNASHEKESDVQPPTSDSADLEHVLKAVVKCASHVWYSIAVELGFTDGEIEAKTYGIPTAEGRLQKMVRVKADAVGKQKAVGLLLDACEKIPNPVIGAVRERIE